MKAKPGFRTCKICKIPKSKELDYASKFASTCIQCKAISTYTKPLTKSVRKKKVNFKEPQIPAPLESEYSDKATNRADDLPSQKSQRLREFCIQKEHDHNLNNEELINLWLQNNKINKIKTKEPVYKAHDGIIQKSESTRVEYCNIQDKFIRVYQNLNKSSIACSDDHNHREY